MKKRWRRIVSVVLALAMVLLGLPEYVSPVKTAKAAEGEESHDVYVLTTAMTDGGSYLIVGVGSEGERYALTLDGTSIKTTEVTVNAKDENAGIGNSYVKATDVDDTCVWTASTDNNRRLKIMNGSYILTYDDNNVLIGSTSDYTNSWSYDADRYCLFNGRSQYGTNRRWVVFAEDEFGIVTTQPTAGTGAIEIYKKECAHKYNFEGFTWTPGIDPDNGGDNRPASAVAVYKCEYCDSEFDVDATIGAEEEILVCGEIPQWKFTASVAAANNPYDNEDRVSGEDDSYIVNQTVVVHDSNPRLATVYVLVDDLTVGKNYLIVNALSGTTYAVGRSGRNTTENDTHVWESRAREVRVLNGELVISGEEGEQAKTYIESVVDDAIWTVSETVIFDDNGNPIDAGYTFEQEATYGNWMNQTTTTCYLFHRSQSMEGPKVYASDSTLSKYHDWTIDDSGTYYIGDDGNYHYLYLNTENNTNTWNHGNTPCNVYFFEETEIETNYSFKIADPIGHASELSYKDEEPATCVAPGHVAGYYCESCENYYEDEEGTQLIADPVLPIDEDAHNWTYKYTWADDYKTVTAKRTCSLCNAEETDTATATGVVTTFATGTKAGVRTWTSDAFPNNDAFEPQTTEEPIPAGTLAIIHSTSLKNSLAINYYVPVDSLADSTNIKLVVQKQVFDENGEEGLETTEITEYRPNVEYKGILYDVFSYTGIAAREMGSELHAKIYATEGEEDWESQEDTYSVATYAYNKLRNSDDDSLKQLLVDMLNYGAAAQEKFEYNTTNLVNKDLTPEQQEEYASEDPVPVNNYQMVMKEGSTAHFVKKSLVLKSSVEIKYYIQFDGGEPADTVFLKYSYVDATNETLTYTIEKKDFVQENDGTWSVKLSKIAAKDMCSVVTAEIYDGDTMIGDVIQYSIESYIASKLSNDNTDDVLRALCKALIKYGKSAQTVLGN